MVQISERGKNLSHLFLFKEVIKVGYSPLVSYIKYSPNCSIRTAKIDTITIHCMAGNLSVETCGAGFANPARKASSNYGIGSDGRIALYVDESKRSWCTNSKSNDNRAITIEVANTKAAHPWPVSDKAYQALIELVADICKRNNIKELKWEGDKSLIGQVQKQNMTVHRWFAAKACPGDYLYERHGDIANKVNAKLKANYIVPKEEDEDMTQEQFNKMMNNYLAELAKQEPSDWSAEGRSYCEKEGIIKGDTEGNKMYKKFITREEMATILERVLNK